jgi:hypothetical protein
MNTKEIMKKKLKKIYNYISNLHWTGDGTGKLVEHRWCYLQHWSSGKFHGFQFHNITINI